MTGSASHTTARPAKAGRGFPVWLGLAPFGLVLVVLFAVPVLSLLKLAFGEGGFTLVHFHRMIDVPVYRSVLGTTLGIAGLVTVWRCWQAIRLPMSWPQSVPARAPC